MTGTPNLQQLIYTARGHQPSAAACSEARAVLTTIDALPSPRCHRTTSSARHTYQLCCITLSVCYAQADTSITHRGGWLGLIREQRPQRHVLQTNGVYVGGLGLLSRSSSNGQRLNCGGQRRDGEQVENEWTGCHASLRGASLPARRLERTPLALIGQA